jgi:AraC family transcriptional regulator
MTQKLVTLPKRMHRNNQQPTNDPRADYIERVNRAIDHIVANLAQPLSLDDISKAACFSPFHFHRVFKAHIGETLNQFIKRLRLERALYLMSHAPKRSLTDVALDCGFSTSSDFSRSFKQHYGIAPRAFDLKSFRDTRREAFERVMQSQEGFPNFTAQSAQLNAHHSADNKAEDTTNGNPVGFEVALRDLPARTVAYIRVLDPYRKGVAQAACERLLAWAHSRGLDGGQWLGYMWNEPEIVALANCRYDVALVVDDVDGVKPAGEIGRFEFPPMRVAEVIVRGDLALEARAIDWLYQTWLPQSGYVPDDQPAFEAWIGKPFEHGHDYFESAVQLPVRRG